jgi:hypothetical protein
MVRVSISKYAPIDSIPLGQIEFISKSISCCCYLRGFFDIRPAGIVAENGIVGTTVVMDGHNCLTLLPTVHLKNLSHDMRTQKRKQ